MCARETDVEFNKKQQHHLTVSHIQKHFSDRVIAGLDKVFMCGTYGDPAAAKHTLEIYRWLRHLNPNITLADCLINPEIMLYSALMDWRIPMLHIDAVLIG